MKRYKCTICGYVYDPVEGDPDGGIDPGTPFEDVPEDWECPVCGVRKSDFEEDDCDDCDTALLIETWAICTEWSAHKFEIEGEKLQG